jgi:hypothetical protein
MGQERTLKEPPEAPSEAERGPASSEGRPAPKQEWGYLEEECGEAPKAQAAEQAQSTESGVSMVE